MSICLGRSIEQLLAGQRVSEIKEHDRGEQGHSGSEVRYYHAILTNGNEWPFITKDATQLERRVIAHLLRQRQAVPPTFIVDENAVGRHIIVQQFADPKPAHHGPFDRMTRQYARAIAHIHAANFGKRIEWLPVGTTQNLYLEPWQAAWSANLGDNAFASEFGSVTNRLDRCFAQFVADMHELAQEGSANTLINADLHPTHMRIIGDTPCLIDWEQSRWAPFYLDLVNYFSKETALIYRDELARLGFEIPVVDFLDRFHAMGRYMGFRYLEVGLNARIEQIKGTEAPAGYYESQRWFLYYCLELALNGR